VSPAIERVVAGVEVAMPRRLLTVSKTRTVVGAAVRMRKAEVEFEKFRVLQLAQPSRVEEDFEAAVKKLPKPKKELRINNGE